MVLSLVTSPPSPPSGDGVEGGGTGEDDAPLCRYCVQVLKGVEGGRIPVPACPDVLEVHLSHMLSSQLG